MSDWVGALLTSLSLLLAVVILWRDQQYKRREQIDHVGWWFGFESGKWGWHVTNASNLPIRVWMQIVRTDGKLFTMIGGSGEQEQAITVDYTIGRGGSQLMHAGGGHDRATEDEAWRNLKVVTTARDNAGRVWVFRENKGWVPAPRGWRPPTPSRLNWGEVRALG